MLNTMLPNGTLSDVLLLDSGQDALLDTLQNTIPQTTTSTLLDSSSPARWVPPQILSKVLLSDISTIIPVLCLAATIGFSFNKAGLYGIAIAALGMLGSLPVALTIDGYGPISDNAGGIAEMCGLPSTIRDKTDALDAAGNTTAAIGKGFAIGSACLVGLALFGAFITRIE